MLLFLSLPRLLLLFSFCFGSGCLLVVVAAIVADGVLLLLVVVVAVVFPVVNVIVGFLSVAAVFVTFLYWLQWLLFFVCTCFS